MKHDIIAGGNLSKTDLKVLKQAYKILHKEMGRFKCKSYSLGCSQCAFDRMMADLKSFIEFWAN